MYLLGQSVSSGIHCFIYFASGSNFFDWVTGLKILK